LSQRLTAYRSDSKANLVDGLLSLVRGHDDFTDTRIIFDYYLLSTLVNDLRSCTSGEAQRERRTPSG